MAPFFTVLAIVATVAVAISMAPDVIRYVRISTM